jgi:hypothetical protein
MMSRAQGLARSSGAVRWPTRSEALRRGRRSRGLARGIGWVAAALGRRRPTSVGLQSPYELAVGRCWEVLPPCPPRRLVAPSRLSIET